MGSAAAAAEGHGKLPLRMKLPKFAVLSGAQVANTASESSQSRQHRPQCLFSVLPQQAMGSCSPPSFSRQVRVTFCWCSMVGTGWGEAGRPGWFPHREWITWGLGREAIGSMALQVGEVKHELPFTREALQLLEQFYICGSNFLKYKSKTTKTSNKNPRYIEWPFVRCLIWH